MEDFDDQTSVDLWPKVTCLTIALEDFKAASEANEKGATGIELYEKLNAKVYFPTKKLKLVVTSHNVESSERSEGWFGKLFTKLDSPCLESLTIFGTMPNTWNATP